MRDADKGFTLIELAVVVAILGILSALSIPLYQDNVINSQMNRALSELSAYRSAFEVQLAKTPAISDDDLGYTPSSLTASVDGANVARLNADGTGHLQVIMGGRSHPYLTGVIIQLRRTSAGVWSCVVDKSAAPVWKAGYAPGGCDVI